MMSGDEAKAKGADQIRDQENENENASSVLEAIVEVYASQDRECDQNAVGDL
jgi:hypothetical protein